MGWGWLIGFFNVWALFTDVLASNPETIIPSRPCILVSSHKHQVSISIPPTKLNLEKYGLESS